MWGTVPSSAFVQFYAYMLTCEENQIEQPCSKGGSTDREDSTFVTLANNSYVPWTQLRSSGIWCTLKLYPEQGVFTSLRLMLSQCYWEEFSWFPFEVEPRQNRWCPFKLHTHHAIVQGYPVLTQAGLWLAFLQCWTQPQAHHAWPALEHTLLLDTPQKMSPPMCNIVDPISTYSSTKQCSLPL